MKKAAQILILEDSPADAELIKRELWKDDLDVKVKLTYDKASFLQALETFTPDIFITDYSLPGFDALTAMGLIRQRLPEVPVVIVSGAIGEEVAIEALKAGVNDYVLKQRLSRLGPVIRRVMDEAEESARRKHAEKALQQAHDMLEKKVQERTRELAHTVEKLQNEIAERQKLEQQLLQAKKMESIGILAGGISHDFNNILTAILGYGRMLKEKIETFSDDESSDLREGVEQILKAANHAADLTKSLLAFSRKQALDPKPAMINSIIQDTRRIIQRIIGEDIELQIFCHTKELFAMIDVGQIEQVLFNLAANARDAMPQGGRLSISIKEVFIREGELKQYDLERKGKYALISVSDTGTGIDSEDLKKVFDPFYTTKGVGKGTGLGLAIIYGIIKQHNGSILVESEVEQGTTFNIYLPLIEKTKMKEETKRHPPKIGGRETLLVVEDEEIVRAYLKKILTNVGYKVVEAGDGEEGLRYFKENAGISLILSDVIMPKLNGGEMLERIWEKAPQVKAIFISGYTANIMQKHTFLQKDVILIEKPFVEDELLQKIRETLDKK